MVAMLAFGGTYAYFTATANGATTGELTVGTVKMTLKATPVVLTTDGYILPGDTLIKGNLEYTNASTVDTYVAVVVTVEVDGAPVATGTATSALTAVGVTFTLGTDFDAAPYVDTTNKQFVYVAKSGDANYTIPSSKDELKFTSADVTFNSTENTANGTPSLGAANTLQGKTVKITIAAYQTQAKNITVTGTASPQTVWTAMKTALGNGTGGTGVLA